MESRGSPLGLVHVKVPSWRGAWGGAQGAGVEAPCSLSREFMSLRSSTEAASDCGTLSAVVHVCGQPRGAREQRSLRLGHRRRSCGVVRGVCSAGAVPRLWSTGLVVRCEMCGGSTNGPDQDACPEFEGADRVSAGRERGTAEGGGAGGAGRRARPPRAVTRSGVARS
jgi:hypothetical protein